jgi:16S rRNA (guanine527-N7)-methyltransferase
MDKGKNQELCYFIESLAKLNITLNDTQIEQFIDYYELLIETNKVMNLTSITDFYEVIVKHFIDSLSITKVQNPFKEKILDLGTGAGFPGIPVKIAFPDTKVVLMDSLKKRIGFLNDVIDKLNLNDITAIHGRAEDYGRDGQYREAFDICTSRAVARLSTLSEYCLPFVRVGGSFIAYKSGNIDEELREADKAISILGGSLVKVEEFELPGTDIKRTLIMIEKTHNTPSKYPRMAGKPSKEPL